MGRKRRGCPRVMLGVSMSVVEFLQGLVQKEKLHIDCEKDAQISISANKIATQWWPNVTVKESNLTIHYIFIFLLLCSHYVADLIKKLELCLIVVWVLLKIKACVRCFYQICTFSPSDRPLKTMKNVIHFI